MTPRIASLLIVTAVTVGTAIDRVPSRESITLGGYRVLAADFHTHSSTWSDGSVTPWGLVLEARHQGLDAIAITGHRQTLDAKWGRWFSEQIGGPTVLVGEELPEIPHHLVAVGIETTVDSALDVAAQIAEIHRQGGIAIAAHPGPMFWKGFEPVMDRLDGAEICHPAIFDYEEAQAIFEQFAQRTSAAAIGSSDFHGLGRLGICRTFVFARENSAPAIIEAIRARRTVVFGRDGKPYGNPELIRLAVADGRLPAAARPDYPASWLDRVSQLLGLAGLAGLVVSSRRRS
ncbi:MAG TPA: PHP-associated domain-containing protein [Vicinamibacterales bacterium]|nr:PHP-associated domain-containing protein [Vicinamibacterales bacterium]